jgi:hypothetical protein
MNGAVVESCAVCSSYNDLEKHHLKPLSKGGKDTPENTVYLCHRCHVRLGDKGFPLHHGKGKNQSRVGTFYLGEPYRETWQEFRAICIREGTTASKKIINFITQYVQDHDEGNPQQKIGRYVEEGKPYFAPAKCSLNPCGRDAVVVAEWKDGTRYFICSVHLRNRIRRNKGWKIIGDVNKK